ncbi:lipoate-protein ligase LplJ [Oxobacter pfennigii]|uniref:lipoate--protein ligase n=1 Tax=Oxobacter pfennigii TaxID=36849 RepID=A0A0P8WTJ3_9CLOT|nr:lipoate--protein ligase [Oxobacter pfennigii]KPU45969.1 lipoate-protein ligase LplJ [Oxobacter pfennigii]
MLYIYNDSINPYFNLACEEYVLKNFEDDCFMLWRNGPSIIIGKNQNTLSEINLEYVRNNNIPVVRRLSGGGAVFHDLGNLNFTFTSGSKDKNFNDFKKFTLPIIEVLNNLSVNAEFSGRNDITIEGKKISGNAQYSIGNRMLHHGTLLFASQIADISAALKVKEAKFEGKSVKSVSSRVTNISSHLKTPLDIMKFTQLIMEHVKNTDNEGTIYDLTNEDISNIQKLADEKYSTWEWNFGGSPKYTFHNEKKLPGGLVEAYLDVKGGIITSAKIYGDFFGMEDISALEGVLLGIKHDEGQLAKALSSIDITKFISGISVDDLVFVLWGI